MDFLKRNKNVLIFCVLIVVILAVLFLTRNYENLSHDQPDQAEVLSENGQEIEYHEVSFQNLIQKEFDGRDLELGTVLEDNSFYTRYFITYKSGDLTISGIMNIPKSQSPDQKFPVLVLNHGHIDTSVYTNGRGLRREQDYLAKNGYAVIHPDYRNHAQSDKDGRDELAVRLGYIEDVINAVLAVKNSNIQNLDTEKIGMLGHSMGGGITLSALTIVPELINAAVLYAPVTGNLEDSYNRWIKSRISTAEQISSLYGTPNEAPDFWLGLNAENYFDNIKAPIRIYHGTADESVPLSWSENTYRLLLDAGKDVELTVFEGAPHEFTSDWGEFMGSIRIFFDEILIS